MKTTRSIVLLAGMGLLALTACGGQQAGAAAIVGDTSITEDHLNNSIQTVLAAQGRSVDDASYAMTSTALDRMITTELVDQLAADLDVEVTQGEIDAVIAAYVEQAGGEEELENFLLQQDVAPEEIPALLRLNLLVEKLGVLIDPQGTPETQSMAVFQIASVFADEVGVTVNPRFGGWDGPNLAVTEVPNDLSVPAQF